MFTLSRASLPLVCMENRFQQTGETRLKIISAQRDQHAPALWHHANQPGFAQHFELMRPSRFRHFFHHLQIPAADGRVGRRQLAHDPQTQRIAQRIQNIGVRMLDILPRLLLYFNCSKILN